MLVALRTPDSFQTFELDPETLGPGGADIILP